MPIRQLDDDTIRKIAAGEVVERPASAVKELIENALDADASRIDVSVEAGGVDGIRVADDGTGMTREEVELAVEEHTTSKIAGIDDLESGVRTLGFRGEALHAIGAVSRLSITTRPREGESDRATELVVDHGEVVSVEPAGRPPGTTVEVRDLFGETPARRKFLGSTATEFDHVNRIVSRYALANPDVAFSLLHDDREVFSTTGQDDLSAAVLSVYGREVAESMIPVEADPDGSSIASISGYVSHPETTRSTREYVSTFVNDRYVSSSTLRGAIVEAYGGQLAADRYPFAVVFLDVDPEAVDANVHPRKLEVRFDDEEAVSEAIRTAVEDALLDHGLIRSSAPRGRSAPEEVDVAPERDSTGTESPTAADATREGRAESGGRRDEAETTDRDEGETTDRDETIDREEAETTDRGETIDREEAETTDRGETIDRDETPDRDGTARTGERDRGSSERDADSPTGTAGSPADDERGGDERDGSGTVGDARDRNPGGRRESGSRDTSIATGMRTQQTLAGEAVGAESEFESLPRMRVLGQLHDTYVVAETDEGLLLIDQHAADERINYERLRSQLDSPATQALAEPVEIEVTAREAALFSDFAGDLADLGFRATRAGERTIAVEAVPAVFDESFDPDLLRDVLGEFLESGETSVSTRVDALLSDLACHPSITGNTSLTEGSVRALLEALDDCENPYACPHGRPVFVEIDGDELDDRFERDYPGHAGRRGE